MECSSQTNSQPEGCPNASFDPPQELPLIQMLNHGKVEEAIKLLREEKADPNSRAKGGWTALHVASLSDLPEAVKALIECGAEMNDVALAGATPLHYAATWEACDSAEELIKSGANIEIETDDQIFYLNKSIPMWIVGGRTALHIAAEKGFSDIVELLLKHGANTNKEDFTGRTPYDLAAKGTSERHKVVCALLRPPELGTTDVIRKPISVLEEREGVKMRLELKKAELLAKYQLLIQQNYKPLHPSIYSFHDSFVDSSVLQAVQPGNDENLKSVISEISPGIWKFPFFTKEFTEKFLEEVENYEKSGMPLTRPNSMNNYGVIVNDIGFKNLMTDLMEKFIIPISKIAFEDFNTDSLDTHHSFVVKYKIGEDVNLENHVDDCEITLNVCLGKQFTGGELEFYGVKGTESENKGTFVLDHEPGVGIVHVGKHWHCAKPIQSGERWNLIVWCKSRK